MTDEKKRRLVPFSCPDEEHVLCKEIIKLSPDGVVIVDALTTEIIYVNPAICKLVGYSEEELLQMKVGDLSPDKHKSKDIDMFAMLSRGEEAFLNEIALITKNNEKIHIEIKANIGKINKRDVVYSFFRDVTERYHEKRDLQEREEQFRIMSDNAPIPVAISRMSDGKIFYANNLSGPALGYNSNEMIGLSFRTHYADSQDAENIISILEEKGEVRNYQLQLMRKDGSKFWALLSLNKITYMGEDAICGGFIDVTDKIDTEQSLLETNKRFNEALKFSRDIIYRSNLVTGTYDYMSSSVKDVTGYTPEEVIEMGFEGVFDLAHPDDREKIKMSIAELRKEAETGSDSIEYRLKINGQYRWFSDSHTVIVNDSDDPIYIIGSVRDITEEKEAEQILLDTEKKFNEALEHSRDIFYRGNFTSGTYDYLSSSVKEITGLTQEEVIDKGFACLYDKIHPDDRLKLKMSLFELRKEVKIGSDSLEYRFKLNGKYRWLSDSYTVLANEKGDPAYIIGSVRDITEEKETLASLEKSEEKYRSLYSNIPALLFRTSPSGQIIAVNDATIKLFGYDSEEDMTKVSVIDIYTNPDDRKKLLEEILNHGEVNNYITEMNCKNGNRKWILLSGKAIYDDSGEIISIDGTGLDITERKLAEDALRQSEEKYRSLYSNIPVVVFRTNSQGQILAINKASLAMFDYDSEEDIKKITAADFYANPDDRNRLLEEIQNYGEVNDFITEINCKSGRRKWTSLSVKATYNDSGELIFIDGIAEDVTERKLAEDALRQSEEKYRSLVQNVNAVISLISYDGEFLFVNKTAAETFHKKPEDFIGKKMWDFFDKEKADKQMKSIRSVIDTKKEIRIEEQTTINNSTYWYDSYIIPVKDFENEQAIAMLISHDITHIREAEEKLHDTNCKLAEERQNLLKKNIALNEVLKQFKGEGDIIAQQINENMELIVVPILNSLEKKLKQGDLLQLEHLRTCLDELTSPFVSKLHTQFASLTSAEVEICRMIKGGLQTKEIAETRKVSVRTIEKFRQIIRKKIKLTNKKINLTNYLRNM